LLSTLAQQPTPNMIAVCSATFGQVASADTHTCQEEPLKLQQYLDETSMSQSEFARKAGIRQSQVWSVLQGKALTIKNAQKCIAASGGLLSFEDLMGEA
jgi:predicted transcriptional regulator